MKRPTHDNLTTRARMCNIACVCVPGLLAIVALFTGCEDGFAPGVALSPGEFQAPDGEQSSPPAPDKERPPVNVERPDPPMLDPDGELSHEERPPLWRRDARQEREPNDVVTRSNGIDQATRFHLGESIAGALDAPREHGEDLDIFKVELVEGELFRWSIAHSGEDLGEGISTLLFSPDMRYKRTLTGATGSARAAFIPQTGVYYLAVHDAREDHLREDSEDASYRIHTESLPLTGYTIAAPGTLTEQLVDHTPVVHRFRWDRDETMMAEVVSHREPLHSGVDPILYIWDVETQRVVASNDNGRRDSLDPAIVTEIERGREHLLIVDAARMRADIPLAIAIMEVDDSPDVPTRLEPGMTWRAEIGDPTASMEHFDTDYFIVTLHPGEVVRVEVDAPGELLPALSIYRDEGGFYDRVDFAAPLGGHSAASFNLSNTASDPTNFYILLDDIRNLTTHPRRGHFHGGLEHGYTLSVNTDSWAYTPEALPSRKDLSFTRAGHYHWFEVALEAGEMLSLVTKSEEDAGVSPMLVKMSDSNEVIFAGSRNVFFADRAGTYRFGVRDEFMRATAERASEVRLTMETLAHDTSSSPVTDEVARHDDAATAQRLEPPARVEGYAQSVREGGYDVYVVHARRGERLALWTSESASTPNEPAADTILHLFDPAGQHIASNDDRLSEDRTTFSAIAHEVEVSGDYFIAVEPYATPSTMFAFQGPYMLHVFSD